LLTHALVPAVQAESAARLANALLSAIASCPFCFVKGCAPASGTGMARTEATRMERTTEVLKATMITIMNESYERR